MTSVLMIDDDGDRADRLGQALTERGYRVTRAEGCEAAVAHLRDRERQYDLVILWINGRHGSPCEALRELQHAGRTAGLREAPLFLCVSHGHLGIDAQLRIERMGARYAWEE